MIQDISHIKATRIVGGVGCGKTQQLIERVCSLLSGGEKAGNVLVLCATPQACESFTLRLNAAGEEAGVNADEIAVTTPRALALEVLSDAEAVRWSGREPRLLTAYEELFLLEDMKVSGLRQNATRRQIAPARAATTATPPKSFQPAASPFFLASTQQASGTAAPTTTAPSHSSGAWSPTVAAASAMALVGCVGSK